MTYANRIRVEPRPEERVAPLARGAGIIPGIAILLCGANISFGSGVSTSLIVGVLLFPLWVSSLHGARTIRILLLLLGLCVFSGLVLVLTRSDGFNFSEHEEFGFLATFIGVSCTIGIATYAHRFLSVPTLALLFSIGWLLNTASRADEMSENLWKYGLSQPLTLLILCLLHRSRISIQVSALLVLSVVGLIQESRSYSGFCLAVALLLIFSKIWKHSPTMRSRGRIAVTGLAIGALGLVAFTEVTKLMSSGALGQEIQNKTLAQLNTSGNLIAGSRPEWAATLGLMKWQPFGYGPGAIPSVTDFSRAQDGLYAINVSATNNYFTQYMFGGQFRLHSIIADFWANFGIVGLLTAAVMLAILIAYVLRSFNAGVLPGYLAFLAVSSVWYLLFGPIFSNYPQTAFSVAAVLLISRTASGPTGMPFRR